MSILVHYGPSYAEMIWLTDAQWEALVVLIVHCDNVHVGQRTSLEAHSVNAKALDALVEKGFATDGWRTHSRHAECTDRAWLFSMEHTPMLVAAVRAAEQKIGCKRSWWNVKKRRSRKKAKA